MMQSYVHCSHSNLYIVGTCLQSDLNAVAAWLCSSYLCLNVGKSNCMLIGSHQRVANRTLHVSVGGNKLTQINSQNWTVWLREFILSFLTSCHWCTVQSSLLLWLNYVDIIQLYKFLSHCIRFPVLIYIKILFLKDLTGHVSHNVNCLFVPRVISNFGRKSFFYWGAVLWNSLPLNISEAITAPSFRNLYFNSNWFCFCT